MDLDKPKPPIVARLTSRERRDIYRCRRLAHDCVRYLVLSLSAMSSWEREDGSKLDCQSADEKSENKALRPEFWASAPS